MDEKVSDRIRTVDTYNLDYFDAKRAAGFYQLPVIKHCDYVPKDLIGFNYMLTTKPKPDTGVHFYLDDYQFERLWNRPMLYLHKLAQWDCILTPDWSLYMDMPMAMKIWNVYRPRLIGQMLQDFGAMVIPTLSWAEKATYDFCFSGIEPGGVVSVSTLGVKKNKESKKLWFAGMDAAIKALNPSCVIEYGGDLGYNYPCQVVRITNHVTAQERLIGAE